VTISSFNRLSRRTQIFRSLPTDGRIGILNTT